MIKMLNRVSTLFANTAILLLVTLVVLPKLQVPSGITDADKRFAIEDAARKTIAQIIAGGFFFVTAYFTWRTVRAAERNVQIAQQNFRISEDKQLTERFFKATEGLGSDIYLVRLGSLFTLERIALDSRKDTGTIIELLCEFIREKRIVGPPSSYTNRLDNIQPIPRDIQSALTILGKINNYRPSNCCINLARTDLRGADFYQGNFSHANFTRSWLDKADLMNADFSNSVLLGASMEFSDLAGANFDEAHLYHNDFLNVDFSDAEVDRAQFSIGNNPRNPADSEA